MSPNIPDKYYRRVPYNIHELDEHRGVKLHGPFPADSPLARFYKQDEAALIELVYQNVLHEKGQREVNQAFKQALSHKRKKRMAIAEEFCKVHGVPVDNVAELTPEAKNAVRVPNDMRMPIFVMICLIIIPSVLALMWHFGLFSLGLDDEIGSAVPQFVQDVPETVRVLMYAWRSMGVLYTTFACLALIHGFWVKQYDRSEILNTDQGMMALACPIFGILGLVAIGVVWLFWVSMIPWIIFYGIPRILHVLNGGK